MTLLAPEPEPDVRIRPTAPRVRLSDPKGTVHAAAQHQALRGRRADIQGLRALAVIAVVGDHFLGRPSGGFLGVDIFFVISGFLITGLLLDEHRRSGRIDLLQFYRRRIKRTVPVAWLVLACTAAVGALTLTVYQVDRLVSGIIAAGSFWSNWHLIQVGTDYLHATDTPTAVQHYWSLAVEEQFYFVWPLVLLGGLALGAKHPRAGRKIALAVLIVLLAASLAWSAVETGAHPTEAYFSTLARGWELLVGAGLAFARPVSERLPAHLRPALAWAGLAALAWGLSTVTVDSAFPYPWALVAVLGTAAVIIAGSGGLDIRVWPLTNRAVLYLGTISYSVYLWHYPVMIFAGVFRPDPGKFILAAELLLVLVLSVLSYHLVEVPFRRGSWRRPRLPARLSARKALAAGAGVVVCGLLAGCVVASHRAAAPPASVAVDQLFGDRSDAEMQRSRSIDAALRASTWPVLTPGERVLGEGARVPEWTRDGCLNALGPERTARRCVYGDAGASRTLVLYGDSVALSYLPGLREALQGRGWRIEVLTSGQCPAVDVSVVEGSGTPYPACDAYHRFALARIAREHPDMVVMVSSYLSLDRLASGSRDVAAAHEWAVSAERTVQQLTRSARRLLVLDAPPIEGSPQSCRTAISSPRDCVTGVQSNWLNAAVAQRTGVEAAGADNVSYPSTLPWFCSSAGLCPSFVDGVVTLADGMHFTEAGSRQLAPLIREAVDDAVGAARATDA